MEILTSVRRLYIRFKSLVNDFVYSFGRAALLLLVEVQNDTVPVRERRRIRVKPRLNTFGCVYERTVILKNCNSVRKQIWVTGITWLSNMSTQSLAVIRPFRVIIGPPEYQEIVVQMITDPASCSTVGTRHLGLQASLGVLQK